MPSEIQGLYTVRNYVDSDKNFVLATFLRGLYYGNEFYNMIPKQVFMDNYKTVGEALISRCTIKVACLADEPEVILGYVVLSKDSKTLHWVFVKAAWRNQGICKSLLPQSINAYTHFTSLGLTLAKKLTNIVFNPFLQ